MASNPYASAADKKELVAAVRASAEALAEQESGHGKGEAGSVRETDYRGHRIRIETTYKISIDDQPVAGHVMVGHDGRVHYHAMPNEDYRSAVGMVERLVDLMMADESDKE